MAILDLGWVKKLFKTGGNLVPPNTSTEIVPPSRPSDVRGRFLGGGGGRHETVKKCRDMYRSDPRIEGVLRTLARDTVRAGFTLTIKDGPMAEKAREVADALLKRVDLQGPLDDWVRLSARDGDTMLELGISAEAEIVQVTRKPSLQMVRLCDEFDRFPDPTKAFAWTDSAAAAMGYIGKDAVFFPEFLIVHARWNHDNEKKYGTPEFAAASGTWKKVIEGELDMAIRRKARAGIKYAHIFAPGTPDTQIEEYQRHNQEALDNKFAAVADYFIAGVDIKELSGDSNIGEIKDVEHHIQTLFASSPVPIELLAYGANLNRDVLGDKKEQYDETMSDTRRWAADQIISPIVERQWLLAGILPESVEYEVTWQAQSITTPDDLFKLLDVALKARELGWDEERVMALLEPYLPASFISQVIGTGNATTSTPAPEANDAATEQTALDRMIQSVSALLEQMEDVGDD